MTCKYANCQTARPLNSLEQPLGWHIPCLNEKHAKESKEGWRMTGKTAERSKPNKRQYSKTGERYQAATG